MCAYYFSSLTINAHKPFIRWDFPIPNPKLTLLLHSNKSLYKLLDKFAEELSISLWIPGMKIDAIHNLMRNAAKSFISYNCISQI
jgi:hypothetical protein